VILFLDDRTKAILKIILKIMSGSRVARRRSPLRWIERALLLVAVLCLGYWGYAWLDSAYVQYHDNQILDAAPDSNTAASSTLAASQTTAQDGTAASGTDPLTGFQSPAGGGPAQPAANEGSLVGRVEIPRLGVSAIVLEGVEATTLRRGVGHIPDTPLPGSAGNVGLAAHRDSFFRALKDIRKNDIIKVKTLAGGIFSYRVQWTEVVKPEDTDVLDDDGATPELTLVTCYPFFYVGSAPNRFIVRARQIPDSDADSGTGTGTGDAKRGGG
jgi:sortase A